MKLNKFYFIIIFLLSLCAAPSRNEWSSNKFSNWLRLVTFFFLTTFFLLNHFARYYLRWLIFFFFEQVLHNSRMLQCVANTHNFDLVLYIYCCFCWLTNYNLLYFCFCFWLMIRYNNNGKSVAENVLNESVTRGWMFPVVWFCDWLFFWEARERVKKK